jgi:hypothetical protein
MPVEKEIAAGNLPERKTNLLPLVKTLKSSDYLKVKDLAFLCTATESTFEAILIS